MKGNSGRGNQLAFGSFGLKTLENCWLTAQQIEAARQALTRHMNREGQVPVTPGRILFEAEGVSLATAKEAMRLAAQKLPVATKFVVRRDYVEE